MRKDGVSHKTLSSISAAEIHAKPPTKKLWWVKKVFRRGQVSCMWGESGSGKTAVVLDLELHLAAGLDWREHEVSQCVVVHVAGEGGGVGIENRVKAWLKRHPEVEPKDVLFEAISDAVDLSNPDDVTALVALLKVIEEKYGMPVGLIVIDTLNATAGKFDENSSRDMGQYARAARSLRNGDDRHVCILHHCGKDRTKGLRGSTAILGFIDAEFEITGGRESWIGELTQPKEREGDPTVERWGFKKVAVDLYRDEDGDIVTAVVADEMLLAADPQKLSFAGRRMLDVLKGILEGEAQNTGEVNFCAIRISDKVWRAACRKAMLTRNGKERAEQTAFTKGSKELLEQEYVAQDDEWWTLARLPE